MGTQGVRVAAPRTTPMLPSCSPNFPCASMTRYTHVEHEPILYLYHFIKDSTGNIEKSLKLRENVWQFTKCLTIFPIHWKQKEQMNPEIKVFSRKKTHASRQRSKYSFFATILNFSLSKRIELRTCLV